jgi:hypothetical protein
MEAFQRSDLADFTYALEFFNANMNEVVDSAGKTVFQKILLTPNSGDYIKNCISNGADCYGVRTTNKSTHKSKIKLKKLFLLENR